MAYARQEQADELEGAVGQLAARLSVVERALEGVIGDVDALLQALMDNDSLVDDEDAEAESDPLEAPPEDEGADVEDEGASV